MAPAAGSRARVVAVLLPLVLARRLPVRLSGRPDGQSMGLQDYDTVWERVGQGITSRMHAIQQAPEHMRVGRHAMKIASLSRLQPDVQDPCHPPPRGWRRHASFPPAAPAAQRAPPGAPSPRPLCAPRAPSSPPRAPLPAPVGFLPICLRRQPLAVTCPSTALAGTSRQQLVVIARQSAPQQCKLGRQA